ncbi:MAG TPA: 50S ribosomal protein L25, partial [Dermatophilaceae bacterium]|nr:50S ribosomal protein L25 [Dermatophilaceae bacterium]
MSEIKLPAERRSSFGKGAARKIRRDHKIPA